MPDIDRDRANVESTQRGDDKAPTDAGRTSGGGSLGHDQPDEVRRDTPIRNADDDPVMPSNDQTLNTKI